MTTRQMGTYYQGEDEQIIYSLTTTSWGSTPTSVTYKVYDVTNGNRRNDVTSTTMTGSVTVTGDVIALPVLKSLTARNTYRIEVKFSSGGNIFEPYFIVNAEN